ncbi:Dbl homology domain-containing protein [Zopfochytrium polystomum]|nr:Dbl homology domain-containing protein [Zopfochytrium polystomum]
MAVGVHVATQRMALFRGSLLAFVGITTSTSSSRKHRRRAESEAKDVSMSSPLIGEVSFAKRQTSLQVGIPPNAAVASMFKKPSSLRELLRTEGNGDHNYIMQNSQGGSEYIITPELRGRAFSEGVLHPASRQSPQQIRAPKRTASNNAMTLSIEQPSLPPSASPAVQPSLLHHPVSVTVVLDPGKQKIGAKYVITEMHQTEQSYLHSLQIFNEIISKIREYRLLPATDTDRAFKYLSPILELSAKMEVYLHDARLKDSGDPSLIVSLFLETIQESEWSAYEHYIKNYKIAKQIVSRTEQRQDVLGDQFRQFCRRIEADEASQRKNLDDFMMLPIQRITRYHLLLERLATACEGDKSTQSR